MDFFEQFKKNNKYPKQLPINKDVIESFKYYIPVFINESEWKKINISDNFDIFYYTYNKNNKSNKTCAIDIGAKYFLTIYTLGGTCFKFKYNGQILNDIIYNKILTIDEKNIILNDLMNELHEKAAKFLCNMFDKIYVGLVLNDGFIDAAKYLKIMDDNEEREHNIFNEAKYLVQFLNHSRFLIILKDYIKQKEKKLFVIEESYTSKICTNCGDTNNFERILIDDDSIRRQYTCKSCKLIISRDMSAARNILIKSSIPGCCFEIN